MSDASIDIEDSIPHQPGLLKAGDFGETWPLSVPYVVIQCNDIKRGPYDLHVLTMTAPDGAVYAINGMGHTHGGYPYPNEIWEEEPYTGGNKKMLTPITEAAAALCTHRI